MNTSAESEVQKLAPGEQAYQQLSGIFRRFEQRGTKHLTEYSRRLPDGTLLGAFKRPGASLLSVYCLKDGREIASFTLNQRGLHSIKVNDVQVSLSGFPLETRAFEIGLTTEERLRGLNVERLAEFRNSAGPAVKWISDMVRRNKFINPKDRIISQAVQ